MYKTVSCRIQIQTEGPWMWVLYLGTIRIHVAKLRDGVFGIDCYSDLASCLVPIEPAWHDLFTLETDVHNSIKFIVPNTSAFLIKSGSLGNGYCCWSQNRERWGIGVLRGLVCCL